MKNIILLLSNSNFCIQIHCFQELKKKSDSLKNKGNDSFRDGDYAGATSTYTEGLRTCPLVFEKDRAILYANRAASIAKIIVNYALYSIGF